MRRLLDIADTGSATRGVETKDEQGSDEDPESHTARIGPQGLVGLYWLQRRGCDGFFCFAGDAAGAAVCIPVPTSSYRIDQERIVCSYDRGERLPLYTGEESMLGNLSRRFFRNSGLFV